MVVIIECYLSDGTIYEEISYDDGKFSMSNDVFFLTVPERYGIIKIILTMWNENAKILRSNIYEVMSEHKAEESKLPVKWFVFDDNQSICAVKISGCIYFTFPKIRAFSEPEGWKLV